MGDFEKFENFEEIIRVKERSMGSKVTLFVRRCIYATIFLVERVIVFFGGLSRPRIVLLCYHSISSDDWRFSVSKDNFKKQVLRLRAQGFEFLTIHQVYDIMRGRKKLSKKAVSIMFDDGYKDILVVKDWLRAQGIVPSVCVLSDPGNASQTEVCPGKEFLSTEDMQALHADGWAIGSHSATHTDFSKMSESDAYREIALSKQRLESALNETVDWFVYPRGYYSDMIVRTVQDAGYKMAFSMDDGVVGGLPERFIIPRIGVDRSHNMIDFMGMLSPLAVIFRKIVKHCIPQIMINKVLGIKSK